MKHKKKARHKPDHRIPLASMRPKGTAMKFTRAKRVHLTGGGWAA